MQLGNGRSARPRPLRDRARRSLLEPPGARGLSGSPAERRPAVKADDSDVVLQSARSHLNQGISQSGDHAAVEPLLQVLHVDVYGVGRTLPNVCAQK